MDTITIYDYQLIEEQEDDTSDADKKNTLYKRLTDIEKEHKKKNNIFILDNETNMLSEADKSFTLVTRFSGQNWTGKYAGLISDKEGTIIIGSRFDKPTKPDSDPNPKHYFVNYLISQAFGNSRIFEKMNPKSGVDTTTDVLLTIIFFHAVDTAAKKGLFRTYQTYHQNDSHVRGTIDIARHIKENMFLNNGKIAYSHREYTTDNSINRLIFTAFTRAKKKYPGLVNELLKRLENCNDVFKLFAREIQPELEQQQIRKLIYQSRKKITHSIYKDWEMARKISIMLLKRLGNSITSDENETIGILIDMNFLFEEYVRKIVGGRDRKQEILFPDTNSAQGRRKIIMDLYWEGEEAKTQRMVFDAKYKNKWSETFKKECNDKKGDWGIRDDVFQVLAYKYITKSITSGIIFPYKDHDEMLEEVYPANGSDYKYGYCIEKNNLHKDFYLLPLIIPDSEKIGKYSEFETKMKESESKLKNQIDYLRGKSLVEKPMLSSPGSV